MPKSNSKPKIFGQVQEWVKTSYNKKYPELDDLDQLFADLQVMSIDDYCRLHPHIPYNSVNSRVKKYFTEEMEAKIVRKRRPHKNRTKSNVKINDINEVNSHE